MLNNFSVIFAPQNGSSLLQTVSSQPSRADKSQDVTWLNETAMVSHQRGDFQAHEGKRQATSQQLPDTELREVTLHPEECSWPRATLLVPSYSFIFTCKPDASAPAAFSIQAPHGCISTTSSSPAPPESSSARLGRNEEKRSTDKVTTLQMLGTPSSAASGELQRGCHKQVPI